MPVPVPDDRISSTEQLTDFASELTDEEVKSAGEIVGGLQLKYGRLPNTEGNLEKLRDEALTKLAEIGILATFDPTPCFYGEPPVVEFVGHVGGHTIHKHGFDHEKKQYEVIKSKERGEHYLGQKGSAKKRKGNGRA